jgi:hypothetical protein
MTMYKRSSLGCPECGAWMVQRTGNAVKATAPPLYFFYWWCVCGHTRDIGWLRKPSSEELAHSRWRDANENLR